MTDGKYTVLVIDDSGLVLRSMKDILQKDYDVKIAVSGKLALKMIPEIRPDVVLLDYEMPVMNGAEVFDEIRKLPEGKELPIIFLTSMDDKATIVELMQKKPNGYLLKPTKQTKLYKEIQRALGIVEEEERISGNGIK